MVPEGATMFQSRCLPTAILGSLASCFAICAVGAFALSACQGDDAPAPSARFVGRWSYALPDPATGEGVATVRCPESAAGPAEELAVPQIGWIDLGAEGDSGLSGTTDQGCTWRFDVAGDTASLASTTQTCFNRNIGSSYTIPSWSLTLDGAETLRESLQAVSHQAVDCAFALPHAVRRRVKANRVGDHTSPFVGSWQLDPPDATGTNVALLSCPAAGGAASAAAPQPLAQTGHLVLTRLDDETLAATTEAGCTSHLTVVGHTAELASPGADCAGGLQPTFWSFAAEGDQAFQTLSGTMGPCFFLLSNSHLVRGDAP
jgi:hypothetical protein